MLVLIEWATKQLALREKAHALAAFILKTTSELGRYMHALGAQCKYAKITKCLTQSHKKCEVNATPGSQMDMWFDTCFGPSLTQVEAGTPLEGVAPPGNMERILQQQIDSMTAE